MLKLAPKIKRVMAPVVKIALAFAPALKSTVTQRLLRKSPELNPSAAATITAAPSP